MRRLLETAATAIVSALIAVATYAAMMSPEPSGPFGQPRAIDGQPVGPVSANQLAPPVPTEANALVATLARQGVARAAAGGPSEEELENRTPEEIAEAQAEDRRWLADRTLLLEESLAAEGRDDAWASTIESEVRDIASRPEFEGTELEAIECSETMCRIEAAHESGQERRLFNSRLPLYLGGKLQHMHSPRVNAPDSDRITVAFMSRDGYSLPAPPR